MAQVAHCGYLGTGAMSPCHQIGTTISFVYAVKETKNGTGAISGDMVTKR